MLLPLSGAKAVNIREDRYEQNVDTTDVFASTGNLNRNCTATLIDRRTVLTAGHCVTSAANVIGTASSVQFDSTGVIAGTSTVTFDNYQQSSNAATPNSDVFDNNDIAIITLGSSVSLIAPVTLANGQPAAGNAITIVGYGVYGAAIAIPAGPGGVPPAIPGPGTQVDAQKRFITNVIDTVNPAGQTARIEYSFSDFNAGRYGANPNPDFNANVTANEGVQDGGDSGGPMFITDAGGNLIQVGVSSGTFCATATCGVAAGAPPNRTYGTVGFYTNVASYLNFIQQNAGLVNARALAGDGAWTDANQWAAATSLGNVALAGLAPDNYSGAYIATNQPNTARARYFDVLLDVAGTKTIGAGDDITVDTLRINNGGATVVVNGDLEAVLDVVPTNTPGVNYAGILLDQGALNVSATGEVTTTFYTQNGGTAAVSGALGASDIFLNGGTLTNGGGAGTVEAIRFRQTGGTLVPAPTLQLDPVTGAPAPGQDFDGFITANYSAIALSGTVSAIGATGIAVTGGGGANNVIVKTSSQDISVGDATGAIVTNGVGIDVGNDFAGGTGNVVIDLGANIRSRSNDAIRVRAASGTGAVVVTGNGNVNGGNGPGDDGIDVEAGGNIFVDVNGAISGDPGINLTSLLGGNITVIGAGDVTGDPNEGIIARSLGGNGNVVVARDGDVTGSTGILASSANGVGTGTGNVTVTALAGRTVTGTTGPGIVASTNLGGLTVNIDGTVRSNASDGVQAVTADGATLINFSAAGLIDTTGAGIGLLAVPGNVDATTTGTVTVQGPGTILGGTLGIRAVTDNDAIFITGLSSVRGLTDTAIEASSRGGDISAVAVGTVVGDASGLRADSDGGIISIQGVGTAGTLAGAGGDGAFADASNAGAGGNIFVGTALLNGLISGSENGLNLITDGAGRINALLGADVSGGTGHAIAAKAGDAGGVNTIDIAINAGVTVSATSQTAILADAASGSDNRITNRGLILGTVTGGAGNEVLDAAAGSGWAPGDLDGGLSVNAFGAGTDFINNAGVLQAADISGPQIANDVRITGVETFTNAGAINMQNAFGTASLATDRVSISSETAAAYVGQDGTLAVDSFLGAYPSPGDLLTIGVAGGTSGSTSGSTLLMVNDTNAGFVSSIRSASRSYASRARRPAPIRRARISPWLTVRSRKTSGSGISGLTRPAPIRAAPPPTSMCSIAGPPRSSNSHPISQPAR